MPNPYGAPEISARDLEARRLTAEPLVWIDVREPWEVRRVAVKDARIVNVRLDHLAEFGPDALPEAAHDKLATIVVQCHHGVRSAQVCAWLRGRGWTNVLSLAGGVAAWAGEVDASIGVY